MLSALNVRGRAMADASGVSAGRLTDAVAVTGADAAGEPASTTGAVSAETTENTSAKRGFSIREGEVLAARGLGSRWVTLYRRVRKNSVIENRVTQRQKSGCE